MPEKNKAVVRAFYEAMSTGALHRFDELLSPDYVDHETPPGLPSRGIESARQVAALYRDVLHELLVEPLELVADETRVAAKFVLSGIPRAPFMGIPAGPARVSFRGVAFFRLEERRLAEHWGAMTLSDVQRLVLRSA